VSWLRLAGRSSVSTFVTSDSIDTEVGTSVVVDVVEVAIMVIFLCNAGFTGGSALGFNSQQDPK